VERDTRTIPNKLIAQLMIDIDMIVKYNQGLTFVTPTSLFFISERPINYNTAVYS